jgi:trimeric autotransporter adhesin
MNFLKRNILPALIVFVTGLVLAVFLYSNNAQARQPDVVRDLTTNPIPLDRSTPFFLYFLYGSASSDIDILNAKSTINITGDGFEFIPTSFTDLYYGSPNRPDNVNPPDVPACNSSYTGPAYAISSTLATTSSLSYGFQTSTSTSTPGGSDQPATLRAKHTGCIRVQVKVKTGATLNQQATITFDPDVSNSPSYQESNRPGKQLVILKIGAASGTITPTTITAANLTAGTCTGVELGATTTCEYPLTGGTTYALPSTPITVTVPGSTVSPACTLSVNKIVCGSVPTTGSTAGTKAVPTSLGSSPTASLVITEVPVVINPTTISLSNISTGSCTTVDLGSTTTCEYPLTGSNTNNYALPTTAITVTVPGSSVSPACTLSGNTSNTAKLTCNSVPTTGSTAGTKAVPTSLGSSPTASLILNTVSNTSSTSTTSTTGTSTSTSGSTSSTNSSTSGTSTTNSSSSTSSTNSSSTSGSNSSTSGSNSSTTTGSTTITGNANDIKTINSPLTGISKYEITLNDQINSGSVTYNLISTNGTCTENITGTRRLANSFTYSFDKAKIKNIKVTFSLPSNVTNIKAFSCSSPGVAADVQNLGNNQYSATVPASATFLVTADTATTTTTARSGGAETLLILGTFSGVLAASYLIYRTRKKLGKVTVVK